MWFKKPEKIKENEMAKAKVKMNFGQALQVLREGKKVAREGWNGKDMWLILVNSDEYQIESYKKFNATSLAPFIAMKAADDMLVPWLASQTDILAEDWLDV